MTDFGDLHLRIDSTEVKTGVSALDELTNAGKRAEQANTGFARSGQQVAVSAGQQRAGMQQLSFQIGDVAQQFALGTNPMIIFAQQGGQVVQAISLMKGSAGGLIGFLAGPWGAVLTGATMILGSLAASHYAAGDAADEQKASVLDLSGGLAALANNAEVAKNAMDALRRSMVDTNKFQDAANKATQTYIGATAELTRTNTLIAKVEATGNKPLSLYRQRDALQAQIVGAQNDLAEVRILSRAADAQRGAQERIRDIATTENKASPSGRSSRAASLSAEEKALKAQNKETERFILNLQAETEKIGLSAAQLRALEVSKAKDAALTDDQRKSIEKLSEAREAALRGESAMAALMNQAKAVRDLNKADGERLTQLDKEFALLGLVGAERERAALALEKEAFMASHVALGLAGATAAWEKYWQTSTRNINEQSRLEKDADAAERARDAILDLADGLKGLGGAGGAIGNLISFTQGDFRGIGGGFGTLLQTLNSTKLGATKNRPEEYLADRIKGIFDGKDSVFGKTLQALQGAGTGITASAAILGSKGNNGGAAIGGALGQTVAGPLGAIVGGILGGLVGGVFKKTTYGTANLGGGSVALSGNRDNLQTGAGNAGNGIMSALDNIASQLGGSLGGFNTSIGVTDGKWNVSTIGTTGRLSAKKQKGTTFDFGEDQASAIKFAISDAIKDGAILGIRASTQALLNKGSDIEAQLTKAFKFQGVFDDLKQATDPVGFALDQVARQLKELTAIFNEAGASAAEYADLEALMAIKRQDAVDSARRAGLDKISDQFSQQIELLGLLGKNEEALTASRILEVAGMKAALQPLQAMIYELQDARSVMEKFAPLAADLRAYREDLLGGRGGASYAMLAAKFRSTADAAMTGDAGALGSLRGVSDDFLSAAKDNARSALDYQRAVGEVLASVDKGIFAADTQVAMAQAQIDAVNSQTNVLQQMRAEINAANVQIAGNTGALLTLWQRFEGDGLTVKTSDDTPLATVAA